MSSLGTEEIARLIGVPAATVRAMVRKRYVQPAKDRRGALRFSFQDLVVLRTAKSLAARRVPARRITEALASLRSQVPADAPISALSVEAAGDRVVVREGAAARDATSGQWLLAFDIRVEGGQVHVLERAPALPEPDDETDGACRRLFEQALALEEVDVDKALGAYERCIAEHRYVAAHINRGRLLHERGHVEEAIAVYRQVEEPDAVLLFNLGVALEDIDRIDEAIEAYERALALDPALADAHYNLAQLRARRGDQRGSLRHLSAYRRLTKDGP